jgi:hypothetical protein
MDALFHGSERRTLSRVRRSGTAPRRVTTVATHVNMMKSLSLALLAGALSGARAEIQLVKGGDMCAGYNSDSDDFKIYYVRPRPPAPRPLWSLARPDAVRSAPLCCCVTQGPCESADTLATDAETTPYFTAETQDMALIKDGDSAYLTDDSKVEQIDATGTFSDAQTDRDGGDGSTYAYVIGQATAGDSTASGTFGTAFYLVQSGSITSAYNTFPAAADGSGEVNVCISEITNGVCGAERTWNAGDLKYTLYGHIEGTDIGATVADYDYLGVRQHVTLQRFDPDTVSATFNDGIALEDMGGTDVTGFTLTFAGGKTASHTFPSKCARAAPASFSLRFRPSLLSAWICTGRRALTHTTCPGRLAAQTMSAALRTAPRMVTARRLIRS